MFQLNLPKSFGENQLVATYIVNHLPSSILDWNTPFELFYNRKPDFNPLKVFGCLCYITIPTT